MRLLFLGDVVGQESCDFIMKRLPEYKRKNAVDICVINGENSSQTNNATPDSIETLLDSGADFITLGNHAFRRYEIMDYLDGNVPVVRPCNYPDGAPGRGVGIIDKGWYRVAVINIMGTAFMEPLGNPFSEIDKALCEVEGCKIVLVDIHAEATGEKKALAYYLDGRVSAVVGTHTHVPTADEQILPDGTAYITDVGMCGPVNSVLGVEPHIAIKKFKTNLPVRFESAKGEIALNGVLIDVDEKTGKARNIERVDIR